MTANVTIWQFDSHDPLNIHVVYRDERGRYDNAVADKTMIRHLLAQFVSSHPTVENITMLNLVARNVSLALAADVSNKDVLYLVSIVEL